LEGEKNIQTNDMARIKIRTTQPLFYDRYSRNRITGSIILIDEATNETVGAGMIIE
jgi:sulfate adenylyltransferase subunit 1